MWGSKIITSNCPSTIFSPKRSSTSCASRGGLKFVVNVDRLDADKLNALLAHFDLKLGASACLPIETNLEGHALSLCPAVEA